MDYDTLARFTDSWGLVFLTVIFLIAIGWAFRPGSGRYYRKQADIPLHDEKGEH